MENEDKKLGWQGVLWAIAVPVIGIVGAVFVGVALAGFQWSLVAEVFKAQWILLVGVFVVVFVLLVVMAKHAMRVAVIGLLVVGVVLMLASARGNFVAEAVRSVINSSFDINFMVGGIGVAAFAVAILAIGNKKRE